MLKLNQNSQNLIGSLKDIKKLENLETCRLLVISDIHGNNLLFKKIIETYGKSCDALIICGDSASDLAYILNLSNEDKSFRQKMPGVLAFVQGNCDPASYPLNFKIQKKLKFSALEKLQNGKYYPLKIPQTQILKAAGLKIFISHGHIQNVNYTLNNLSYAAQEENCFLALYGHTHIACQQTLGINLINPGSCSQPRGGQLPCFCIITITQQACVPCFMKINPANSSEGDFSSYNPIY